MSMHIVHPSLSLNGKKKGKKKFRNSEEARRSRELETSWKELQKKWGIEKEESKRKRAMSAPVWTDPTPSYRGQHESKPKSLNTWVTGAVATKPTPQYSGTNILGISTLHKSNAVPVFSSEEAQEHARMRR